MNVEKCSGLRNLLLSVLLFTIAFAVPPSASANKRGKHPGYLGVELRDTTAAEEAALPSGSGVEIQAVERDGPAEAAGLRPHDIILKFNGQAIESAAALVRMTQDAGAGSSVSLTLLRDGQPLTLTATLMAPLIAPLQGKPFSNGAFLETGSGDYFSRDGHFSFATDCLVTGTSASSALDALNSLTPDTIHVQQSATSAQVDVQGSQCGTHSAAWTGLITAALEPADSSPLGDQLNTWVHKAVETLQKSFTVLSDTGVQSFVYHLKKESHNEKKEANFSFVSDTIAVRQPNGGPAGGVVLIVADGDTLGIIHIETVVTTFNLQDPNLATVKSIVSKFLTSALIWRDDHRIYVAPATARSE